MDGHSSAREPAALGRLAARQAPRPAPGKPPGPRLRSPTRAAPFIELPAHFMQPRATDGSKGKPAMDPPRHFILLGRNAA